MEVWKKILGFEKYEVSNLGNVKSLKPNNRYILLKKRIGKYGYCRVMLQNKPIKKECLIHRLVAFSFLENPEKKPQINHIDCDKSNNKLENLEWCTASENQLHSVKNGRNKKGIKVVRYNDFEEKTYNSITLASLDNNVSKSSVRQCLIGKSKTCNKYKWKYK